MRKIPLITLALLLMAVACTEEKSNTTKTQKSEKDSTAKGGLFIIGGGKRPPSLIDNLIQVSRISSSDYIIILPMSSSVPDTSAYYASKQFIEQGFDNVHAFNFEKGAEPDPARIDSIEQAALIYISGGDQNRFMEVVKGTSIYDAMHEAYKKGPTIAGPSAGAAIMSKKMITGDEHKHPEYTGDFRTIEANNIEIAEGMGFTDKMIVDQHFIWRMRMNRLISVAIEHPEELAIGIDESTAIYVKNNTFKVYGESQVIVIDNEQKSKKTKNGLLGARQMKLNILLPGEEMEL